MKWIQLNFQWNWSEFCGPEDNFIFWDPVRKDIGHCFQSLCFHIPILFLIALTSSWYCGKQTDWVVRSKFEFNVIRFRCLITFLLFVVPVVRTYIEVNTSRMTLHPVNVFLSAVQTFTWLVHFTFVLALRYRLGFSLRGPLLICFLWTINFVLCWITLWSDYLLYINPVNIIVPSNIPFFCSLTNVILQCLYGLSLLPSSTRSDTHYQPLVHAQNVETTPLLGAYSRFREDLDPYYLGEALEGWSYLARIMFSWVDPLMRKGYTGNLNTADDLFDLPLKLTATYLSTLLEKALEQVLLLRALHRCFWKEFYVIGVLKLVADVSGFFGPLLLNRLVTFIETRQEAIQYGYFYAGGLCFITIIGAFCNSHFNFLMAKVGLKIRGALICVIYKKVLSLNTVTLSSFGVGKIINFMSTDADRIVNSCPSFHSFWSLPFQIAVTLYLLYQQVGLAFLAGLVFSILLIPVNKYIASHIGKLSTKLMNQKDERVKTVSEVLKGIRAVKLHVWEDHFIKKISEIRNKELKYLKGRKYLDAVCVYFWATTPVMISILTFTTYTLLGNKLTAAKVFTSIALLNMLIAPLNAFPWVLNGLTEAWVSLKRIQTFLQAEDVVAGQYYNPLPDTADPDLAVAVKDASFDWGTDQQFRLSNINLITLKGQFVGVSGVVGSGKSSLLVALLAELRKTSGFVAVLNNKNAFAYVSQTPWLQHGTLRDNILFGKTYDQTKYKAVLDACALLQDVETLPGGDQVGVGEGGVTLSGGQKARVALARAVYQDSSVYLLDDVLSAVDVRVARHILQHCILGLLRDKTRILCTHQTQYLLSADTVLLMEDGQIIQQGLPSDVLVDYAELLTSTQLESSSYNARPVLLLSSETHRDNDNDSILEEERRETGSVSSSVYSTYLSSVGYCLTLTILFSLTFMQFSRNAADWWMAYWVTHMENSTDKHNNSDVLQSDTDPLTQYYLTVYIAIACVNSLFTLIRAFLFAYGGLQAAKSLHKSLLCVIIRAKVTFFDISPLGRILNRFSSDVYTIDDSLPFIMNILLAQFFGVVGSIVITTYGLPWLSLVLVPLIPVYHSLQDHYRLTSRELKRLGSVTLSPIYNHFNETIRGLITIRAFRAVSRFRRENESKLESNQKAQLASQAASQWLSLRLQLIGVAMVTGVGIIAVLQHQFSIVDPGLVGLAVTYALSMTGLLGGVVNALTETEREMVSVERVEEYLRQTEVEDTNSLIVAPPYAWPIQGVITFNKVYMKYRQHLPPSLRSVSFSTRPAEHIGVVGRTGAGKSSMLAALFRMVELMSGEIIIDTVNIAHIGLTQLRSRMSVIPQEAFLFTGTIRENIDPLMHYQEGEIWTALQRCHLHTVVRNTGGLDSKVTLSVGQAQLLCLTRAVLHNAKILCIDEATANVDEVTDKLIQETIRNCFRQSTVITIAHRVRTIMESDRVLVMGDGQVLEFDSPQSLLQDRQSYFYSLLHQHYD